MIYSLELHPVDQLGRNRLPRQLQVRLRYVAGDDALVLLAQPARHPASAATILKAARVRRQFDVVALEPSLQAIEIDFAGNARVRIPASVSPALAAAIVEALARR